MLEQEDNLAEVVFTFARRGFPFTPLKLRELAYELASKSKRNGFSPLRKKAGRYWLRNFLQRYPILRKKNNSNLSIYRAICANKGQVKKFFDLYTYLLKSYAITWNPNHIWNVDECGVPDIPNDGNAVVGVTGERAFTVVGAEKGENTTVLTYISAGGMHSPPCVVFKGTKVMAPWREHCPAGYMLRTSATGYINQEVFFQYGEHFVSFLKDTGILGGPRKIIVLFDMHKSHLFNLKYMDLMKKNNIEVVAFPPHMTHVIQPLDDLPFARFKSNWHSKLAEKNFQLVGQKITKIDFFKVLVPSFEEAMTYEIITKAWANTGTFPPNPQAKKLREIGQSETFDKCK